MASMDTRTLFQRLVALALGVVLGLGICWIFTLTLPAQSNVPNDVTYDYVYSGAKSSSTAFTVASMTDDSLLVFGSSELSTSPELIPEVPYRNFGETSGISLTYVGEAYDQSLWHAIAAGAYAARDLPHQKIVFLVGPTWFEDGGLDESTFEMRFSFSLWKEFCANKNIPNELKEQAAERLLDEGVDESLVDAGLLRLPQDALNAFIYGAMDDLRLRGDLLAVRQNELALRATATDIETSAPDFETLRAKAALDATEASDTNAWGVENAFWTERLEPALDKALNSRSSETLQNTPEYKDLALFLEVCQVSGLEPLVVIEPLLGPYYDHLGISAETRAACYERIRAICAEANVKVADFSDREYEPGFLFDIVHFGWKGWVDVEEAIWNFAKGSAA